MKRNYNKVSENWVRVHAAGPTPTRARCQQERIECAQVFVACLVIPMISDDVRTVEVVLPEVFRSKSLLDYSHKLVRIAGSTAVVGMDAARVPKEGKLLISFVSSTCAERALAALQAQGLSCSLFVCHNLYRSAELQSDAAKMAEDGHPSPNNLKPITSYDAKSTTERLNIGSNEDQFSFLGWSGEKEGSQAKTQDFKINMLDEGCSDNRTTVIIRGIPAEVSLHEFVVMLTCRGMIGYCNFVDMPHPSDAGKHQGRAVVDLINPKAVKALAREFENVVWPVPYRGRTVVSYAKVQGIDKLLLQFNPCTIESTPVFRRALVSSRVCGVKKLSTA